MKRGATVGLVGLLLLSALIALPSARAQSAVQVLIPGTASDSSEGPGYLPDTITVVIGVNSTVVWKNDDSADHTVTSFNTTAGEPDFDSGLLSSGRTYSYNFTVPGTYLYHCTIHSWMIGYVVVKPATSPVPEFPTYLLMGVLFAVLASASILTRPHSHTRSKDPGNQRKP